MKSLDEFASEEIRAGLNDADLIAEAEGRGFLIMKPRGAERTYKVEHGGERVRIAVLSDTHLGSLWQQSSYLHAFYEIADKWKADLFVHCGDLVDGSIKMHRDMPSHVFKNTYKAQRDYAVETYPRSKRAKTWMISGNHDYSFVNGDGGDIVEDFAAQRDDVVYLGQLGAMLTVGPLRIYVHHPAGGVPYARSYRLQKWIEQVAPENKPHLYLAGHTHTAAHLPGYRNVEGFYVPCFQAQTPFLVRLGLDPVIGGLLLEVIHGPEGLRALSTTWRLWKKPIPEDW